MVAFNQRKPTYTMKFSGGGPLDDGTMPKDHTEIHEGSDDFDSTQHLRDIAFWSGLSLAIGIFIGMAVATWW